jgi:hypothetical protein
VVDRQVLYLGEINDSQKEAWLRCIEVLDETQRVQLRLALFPAQTPCQFSALWSHFVFGVKEPLNFRRNGASKFAA